MQLKSFILTLFALAAVCSAQAQGSHKVSIAAHRGFWKSEGAAGAQNSIAALREAQEMGAWGSEFDVHMTKDDVVVVNHDETIDGILIQSANYADLKDCRLVNGEPLPTLDDYLTQGEKCATTKLVLEIKWHESPERNRYVADRCI